MALGMVLLLIAVYVPNLADLMRMKSPKPAGWALMIGMSLAP